MVLPSDELLFSLEGDFNNEVAVKNAIGRQVATVVIGKSTGISHTCNLLILLIIHPGRDGRVVLLTVLDAAVDSAILVVFCMYVLRTL